MKSFPAIVDHLVSDFLGTHSFITLRSICHTHYVDPESWSRRTLLLPIQVSSLNMRERIALHYLLTWSLQFQEEMGSVLWYNRVVEWLEYSASIKIMHTFFLNQPKFTSQYVEHLDLSGLSSRRRFLWQRLWHRYRGLYKRKRTVDDGPSCKRHCVQYQRTPQLCY
jgi:hypothetical protein